LKHDAILGEWEPGAQAGVAMSLGGTPGTGGGMEARLAAAALDRIGKKDPGFHCLDRAASPDARPWPVSESPDKGIHLPHIVASPRREPKLPAEADHIVIRVWAAEEKVVRASADWGASQVEDRVWPEVVGPPQSSMAVRVPGAIDQVAGVLQSAVTSSFNGVATGLGVAPGAAAVSAGICSNLVLAPITGPLDKVATFIEVAGLIAALATGAHPLALACGKLLLHSQVEKLLARELVSVFDGPGIDLPRVPEDSMVVDILRRQMEQGNSLAQAAPSPEISVRVWTNDEHPVVPQATAAVSESRQNASSQPPWLCLGFSRQQPPDAALHTADNGTADGGRSDIGKIVILPPGNDEFLTTLPAVLDSSFVLRVDVRRAKLLRRMPEGCHFVLSMGGAAVGGTGGMGSSQSGYQHPGCRTGRCTPRGRSDCRCSCAVCSGLRPRIRSGTSA
jgi:hypothetical protein